MRVKVDLQSSVKLANHTTIRYATGEMDAAGVLWLDEKQHSGRTLPPGCFIHLGSRVTGQRDDAPVTEKPAKSKASAAA